MARLSAKPILNFGNINFFSYGNQWNIAAGEPNTLYFQIIDTDQAINGHNQGFGIFSGITPVGTTAGSRYLVGVGSSNQPFGVMVTFMSIDSNAVINAQAVQVDANDSSIWKVSLSSSQIPSGGNVQFAVTEGTATRRFSVLSMLSVDFPESEGSC